MRDDNYGMNNFTRKENKDGYSEYVYNQSQYNQSQYDPLSYQLDSSRTPIDMYNRIPAPNQYKNIKSRPTASVLLNIIMGIFLFFAMLVLALRMGIFSSDSFQGMVGDANIYDTIFDYATEDMEIAVAGDETKEVMKGAIDFDEVLSKISNGVMVMFIFIIVIVAVLAIGQVAIDKNIKMSLEGFWHSTLPSGIIILILGGLGKLIFMAIDNSMEVSNIMSGISSYIFDPFVILGVALIVIAVTFKVVSVLIKEEKDRYL